MIPILGGSATSGLVLGGSRANIRHDGQPEHLLNVRYDGRAYTSSVESSMEQMALGDPFTHRRF
ncbi:hypothetical protein Mapa_005282 [Marchantia paleacea]|nr:hypothetical protein Mapa_005282 [Marchantia paleacea]